MTASASTNSGHCSQLSMLSMSTRKAIRADLRQRITDELARGKMDTLMEEMTKELEERLARIKTVH